MTTNSAVQGGAVAGRAVACPNCRGSGLVSVYSHVDFEGPGECRYCAGGSQWEYPNGALAAYPGGPFVGHNPKPSI